MRAPLILLLATLGFTSACNPRSVDDDIVYGRPPPPPTPWDPGPGGGGSGDGGYGYSGDAGVAQDGGPTEDGGPVPDAGPMCEDERKRCAAQLRYPFGGESSVELRGNHRPDGWVRGDVLTRDGQEWIVTASVPFGRALEYKFLVNGVTWILDPRNPSTVRDSQGNTNSLLQPTTCAAFTCAELGVDGGVPTDPIDPPMGVFDWRDAVLYFVFVDRFKSGSASNNCNVASVEAPGNFQGGDFAGVRQKIDDGYFSDLGVNTLWLTVPVKQTNQAGRGIGGDTHLYSGYHGYWPIELGEIEPCFGTRQELTDVITAAHARGLKVIFDFAMVHVHTQSRLFREHPEWFWPNERNGRDCICGQSCDWNADGQRCWFADYLPHWNYTVPEARDYSVNAAVQLALDFGIDGFRLDAIKHVDGSWLTTLRARIEARVTSQQTPRQRFYMVGETYDFGDRGFLRSFIDPRTKLDGQFDFPLRLQLVKALLLRQSGMDELARFMDGNDDFYGSDAVMSPFAGNHDLPRIIHIAEDVPLWGDPYSDGKNLSWANPPQRSTSRRAYERLANAFALLFTNRGAPLLYYGDEVGLPGAGDPDNRRLMQFDNLTSDQTWLRERVSRLLAVRKGHPALRRGRRTTVAVTREAWLYRMSLPTDTVYVAINRGDTDTALSGLPASALSELITTSTQNGPSVTVPARQTRIYVVQP